MSNYSFERYHKRRLFRSYVSVVFSISSVLLLLGILALLVVNSGKLASHFKEKIAVTVYLRDQTNTSQIAQLKKQLVMAKYTKKLTYINKEQSAKDLSKNIGEDFVSFLGYNPLLDAFELYLKASYVSPKEINFICKIISDNPFVDDVIYDQPLVISLDQNIHKITIWMLIITSFFSVIAIVLINSTIRLSVYNTRFTIKSMQLVGATRRFIRKPFMIRALKLGFFAALLAIAMIALILFQLQVYFPEFSIFADYKTLIYVALGITIVGMLISRMSAYFATQRFLRLKLDELYY